MRSGSCEEGETSQFTPIWVVATACTVIVAISLGVGRLLHYLGACLKTKHKKPLFEALQKVKEGGIKRHNGSKSQRELGSIGPGTTPRPVHKGKKMPSRMGGTRKIRKLKIVKVDDDLCAVPVSLEILCV